MIRFRTYRHPADYARIDEFLIRTYRPGNLDGNWVEPAWEYMHHHPNLDSASLEKIGVWEDDGQVVAAVHYEWRLGDAFFQFHPDYRFLRAEMLDYAESSLYGVSPDDGRRYLMAFVNDIDTPFTELVRARGYQLDPAAGGPVCSLDIPQPFPAVNVPPGFRLTSLAEECDWAKVNRVMWRGFNHAGEPPASAADLEDRRRMFDTPSAHRDLKIAVAALNGDFVAFCGMFYEPTARFAYVEPVATDPDYRRLGLGRSAVLEGIRRCAALGATTAYVISDQMFYQAMGFKKAFIGQAWLKYL